MGRVVVISAGILYTFAVNDDGSLWALGNNFLGHLIRIGEDPKLQHMGKAINICDQTSITCADWF